MLLDSEPVQSPMGVRAICQLSFFVHLSIFSLSYD
jgi:hypothetical protein